MIPERIAEPDRTWLTIAAYNVGFGHLEDARVIAQSRGKNPDSWADVRDALPLLGAGALVRAAPSAATRAAGSRCSSSIASSATSRLLEWQPGEARGAVATPALEPRRRRAGERRGSLGARTGDDSARCRSPAVQAAPPANRPRTPRTEAAVSGAG